MNTCHTDTETTTFITVNSHRKDFRGEIVFSVDGKDCQRIDDAISITQTGKGYRLSIHIADVAHYVHINSQADKQAAMKAIRGKDTKLLGNKMAKNICSLCPGKERNTLSIILYVRNDGVIYKTEITKGLIRSRMQCSYSEIDSLVSGECTDLRLESISKDITEMRALYVLLRSRRLGKDTLSIDRTFSAHRMIEEFMIIANKKMADYLCNEGLSSNIGIFSSANSATSPIRKMGDLKVHQVLDMHLNGESNETVEKELEKYTDYCKMYSESLVR